MAVYPVAAGMSDIGSTTMGYTPTIYSGKLVKKLYANTVFGAVANTDYEGEIKSFGESVKIRSLPNISIRRYAKGQNLVPEQPKSTALTLNIDKGYYWAFIDEDVERAQTDLKNYVDLWTDVAARQLQIAIDADVLQNVYADASSYNQGLTAGLISGDIDLGVDAGVSVELTVDNVINKIVQCGQVLDEQNVPPEGRWMIVPAWVHTLLLTSDLKAAFLTGDATSPMRHGRVGMIDTFTIYRSNQLGTSSDTVGDTTTHIMFGTNHAITFATQLVKNEQAANPFGFGNIHKGLQVYGYKVVLPEALGWLYAKKG